MFTPFTTQRLTPNPQRLWVWPNSNAGQVTEEELLAHPGVPATFEALLVWLQGFADAAYFEPPVT